MKYLSIVPPNAEFVALINQPNDLKLAAKASLQNVLRRLLLDSSLAVDVSVVFDSSGHRTPPSIRSLGQATETPSFAQSPTHYIGGRFEICISATVPPPHSHAQGHESRIATTGSGSIGVQGQVRSVTRQAAMAAISRSRGTVQRLP